MGGNAYEFGIDYNIIYKFFIEDIKRNKLSPNHFISNELNQRKNEILFNFNKNVIDIFDEHNIYKDIYIKSDTDYIATSDNLSDSISKKHQKKVNYNIKNITQIEFDLFLKKSQR